MGLLDFFRKPKPSQTVVFNSENRRPKRKDITEILSHDNCEDRTKRIREGLDLVKARKGFKSRNDAVLFLIDAFKAHEERRMLSEGVPTIRPTSAARNKFASAASSLPKMPKMSLAPRNEHIHRIKICNAALREIEKDGLPVGLRKDWEYQLSANERVLALIDSGLPIRCRKTQGILVDDRHYYRQGKEMAKFAFSKEWVRMDVHQFIAEVGRRAA